MFKKYGLQVKLPLLIFMLFFLPLLGLSIFVFEYSQINDETHMVKLVDEKVNEVVKGFNARILNILVNMKRISNLPEVINLNKLIENSKIGPEKNPKVLSAIKKALTALDYFQEYNLSLSKITYYDKKTNILADFDKNNLTAKLIPHKEIPKHMKEFYKKAINKVGINSLRLVRLDPYKAQDGRTKLYSEWVLGVFRDGQVKGLLTFEWEAAQIQEEIFPLPESPNHDGWVIVGDKFGKKILNSLSLYKTKKSVFDIIPTLPKDFYSNPMEISWDTDGDLIIYKDLLDKTKKLLEKHKIDFTYDMEYLLLYSYPDSLLSKEIVEFRNIILAIILGQVLLFTPFLIILLFKSKSLMAGFYKDLNKTNSKISKTSEVIDLFTENLTKSNNLNTSKISNSVNLVNGLGQKFFNFKQLITDGRSQNSENVSLLTTTRETFKQLEDSLDELAKSSSQVETITTFMNDMAFKTNLLALNASVEAARAGEEGKGFAVVAKAIRELAENSSSATKKISKIVKENTKKSKEGRDQARKGHDLLSTFYKNIESGNEWIAETFNEIDNQVSKMDLLKKELNEMEINMGKTSVEAKSLEKLVPDLKKETTSLNLVTSDMNKLFEGEK